jgi:hypothetical protein
LIILTPRGIEALNPFAIKTIIVILLLSSLIIIREWRGNQGRAINLIIHRANKAYDFQKDMPDIPNSLYYLITGFILGKGGCMYKHKKGNKNALFRLSDTSFLFIIWVASLFIYIGLSQEIISLRKNTKTFEFKTYHIEALTYLFNAWYPNNKYAVPNYVFIEFNALILSA